MEESIRDLAELSLSADPRERESAMSRLRRLLEKGDLPAAQHSEAVMALAQTLQSLGRHRDALSILADCDASSLASSSSSADWLMTIKLISLRELGDIAAAAHAAEVLSARMELSQEDDVMRGGVLLEVGKTLRRAGRTPEAVNAWRSASALLQGKDESQFLRAESNVALAELGAESAVVADDAAERLEILIGKKAAIGDLNGVATNYSGLAAHFKRRRRFGRAISFARRDVKYSREFGDAREVAIALENLADIYAAALQFKEARHSLSEALRISESLGDDFAMRKYTGQIENLAEIGRAKSDNCVPIGKHARCACSSGELYSECCGRADFDPPDGFSTIGIAEQVPVHLAGVHPSNAPGVPLDYILRDDGTTSQRVSWQQLHVRDGWYEMFELADMANVHLNSARLLLRSMNEDTATAVALSVVVLSVCSLEAFINQVVFFVSDRHLSGTLALSLGNPIEYQRKTELTEKWAVLSSALTGDKKLANEELWKRFKSLVVLRNELVHFKAAEYEQVIPRPSTIHPVVARLPAAAIRAEVHHCWPFRVLNAEIAAWAIDTATSMLHEFRVRFRDSRQRAPSSSAKG